MERGEMGVVFLLSVVFIAIGIGYYFGWGLTFLVIGSFLGVVVVMAWRGKENEDGSE